MKLITKQEVIKATKTVILSECFPLDVLTLLPSIVLNDIMVGYEIARLRVEKGDDL